MSAQSSRLDGTLSRLLDANRLDLVLEKAFVVPAPRLVARHFVHHLFESAEEADIVEGRVAVPRHDAVVAVKRRPMVEEVRLARDNELVLLQEVDPPRGLRRRLVAPLVQLLGEVDEGDGRGGPEEDEGVVDSEEPQNAHGGRRLADLVDVVAHLAVRDGPGKFVVPLERLNLGAEDGGLGSAVVVHGPVVDATADICELIPHQDGRERLEPHHDVRVREQEDALQEESRKQRERTVHDFALLIRAFQHVAFHQRLEESVTFPPTAAATSVSPTSAAFSSNLPARNRVPARCAPPGAQPPPACMLTAGRRRAGDTETPGANASVQ
eukprot:CAMPEP_0180207592 /NCGR_PEP_ID=MMETSP0987-20121128/10242_1 /TAXON_ID=697907 /ORGANISM="non described non described, Strain CCMP2293" /LENGTH=324 /DNA_ID=CAMNT_0022163589 /DNA_START=98 /DNA_END=1073 /DNA_ORIENTATION=+